MPATLILAIIILFLILLSFGEYVFFRRYQKNRQIEYESRIKGLDHDLAEANTQITKQAESFNTRQDTSAYEKYAGVVLSQMDRAVVVINQDLKIGLINNYAKQFLDLNASVGMPYKDIIHVRTEAGKDNYALFDVAFSGKTQKLPGNSEIVSQHGNIPINGTILPLVTGQAVTSVVFIFENNSNQVARVKEEQAFFSAAAHELRTPLTVIRMTVSLLREKFDSMTKDKIMEHLKRTDETSERLVKLVNDFLNISRIDQGRLEIKPERFDIVTLTDEVIGNLALLAKERNLYVHHEINGSQRMVVADRTKTAEVLSNLISNGLKYTLRGGLTITHKATETTLTTTVSDTGPGIPQEMQSLLFKRFGQVGESREHVPTKSTGLGLYICKKFAELMRGDVVLVKSEPGTGSAFAFVLPLH